MFTKIQRGAGSKVNKLVIKANSLLLATRNLADLSWVVTFPPITKVDWISFKTPISSIWSRMVKVNVKSFLFCVIEKEPSPSTNPRNHSTNSSELRSIRYCLAELNRKPIKPLDTEIICFKEK